MVFRATLRTRASATTPSRRGAVSTRCGTQLRVAACRTTSLVSALACSLGMSRLAVPATSAMSVSVPMRYATAVCAPRWSTRSRAAVARTRVRRARPGCRVASVAVSQFAFEAMACAAPTKGSAWRWSPRTAFATRTWSVRRVWCALMASARRKQSNRVVAPAQAASCATKRRIAACQMVNRRGLHLRFGVHG